MNGYLLTPLPVHHPQQIMVLAARQGGDPTQVWFVSYPDLVDFRKQAALFSDIFADQYGLAGLSLDGKTNHFFFSYVTGNYFSGLGVKPAAGRLFVSGEGETPGSDQIIVMGYSFWQKKFGGDPGITGKQVLVGDKPATVVGIVAKEFHGTLYPAEMDGYAPLSMTTPQQFGSCRDRPVRYRFVRFRTPASQKRAWRAFARPAMIRLALYNQQVDRVAS